MFEFGGHLAPQDGEPKTLKTSHPSIVVYRVWAKTLLAAEVMLRDSASHSDATRFRNKCLALDNLVSHSSLKSHSNMTVQWESKCYA